MRHLLRTLGPRLGLLLVLLLSVAGAARAQGVGYGDWQLHLATGRGIALADAGARVYVASVDAFFYFDKELNTTTTLSRRDGLNDVGVTALAYDSVSQQVLVAYQNGNLDLISADGRRIRNINDIRRKQISGNKTINHINFSGKLAYLSCDFGLLVLDMAKLEVRDTYASIGPGGQQVKVYASTVGNGFLFAATSVGVLRAPLTSNLIDYRAWTLDLPGGDDFYRVLATHNGQVYTARKFGALFRYSSGTTWVPDYALYSEQYSSLASSRAGLIATGKSEIFILTAPGVATTLRNPAIPEPRGTVRSRDGALYIADLQRGLLRTTDRRNYERFVANAPQTNSAFGLLADPRTNIINVFTGAYDLSNTQVELNRGFYEYQAGKWTNFNRENYPDPRQFPELKTTIRGSLGLDGTLYVGTWGQGLLRWKGPGDFKFYNPTNSPLLSAELGNINFTRVGDVATAANGDIWVTNLIPSRAGQAGLHVLSPGTETWRSINFTGATNLDRLVLDDFGAAWVTLTPRNSIGIGLVAYNEETRQSIPFSEGSGGLPSNRVYSIAKDRKGDIWVGTDKGVATFSDPGSAFAAGGNTTFTLPYVGGFPTLYQDIVRAIAVDGANRKWFGTDNGLWLFNETGDEALLNFTTANSPLPSNRIVDIAVNDRTGEVFVATEGGVVAYRGNATVTEGKPECAKVSPNPVRTNFQGEVGVSGLANNAIIKITDVTGKLVYQTRANGGTVTWNLADYNGRKVQSGVYLVLSSDADGKNGCISKIAVVQQ